MEPLCLDGVEVQSRGDHGLPPEVIFDPRGDVNEYASVRLFWIVEAGRIDEGDLHPVDDPSRVSGCCCTGGHASADSEIRIGDLIDERRLACSSEAKDKYNR